MKFIQFLNEEMPLNPEHKREFKALGKKVKYRERYTNLFPKGVDNIYFKIPDSVNYKITYDNLNIEEEDFSELLDYLKDSYKIKNDIEYMDLAGVNLKKKTISFYKEEGGIFTDSIENFLNNLKKGEERLTFLNMFKYMPKEGLHKNLSIVITRSPEEIGGMSTNRAWKSCMNLYSGCYNSYTRRDVEEGTLAVYLIDTNDKKIEKPLGRMLIKPFQRKVKGETHIALRLTDNVYGTSFPKSAIDIINRWLDEKQKDIESAMYYKNKKLYDDEGVESFFIGKLPFKKGDKVEYTESYGIGKIIYINRSYDTLKIEVYFPKIKSTEIFYNEDYKKLKLAKEEGKK